MVKITINDESADLYVVMRGSMKSVGRIADSYRAAHIGIRCDDTLQVELIKDWLTALHEDGYWSRPITSDRTQLVNIKLSEVREVVNQLNLK